MSLADVGLVTRRYAYNMVFNLRPRRSRWRPYVDTGPAFQLLSLSGAPLKKPDGYFRLGLSNVGLIKAAFDFGNISPPRRGRNFPVWPPVWSRIQISRDAAADHARGLW